MDERADETRSRETAAAALTGSTGGSLVARLAFEGSVIVASILVAFAIDAWWDLSEEREQEVRLLGALARETSVNLAKLEQESRFRRKVLEATLGMLAEPGRPSASGNQFDRLLGDLLWLSKTDFSVGALETVLSGGVLSVIEDPDLRSGIAEMRVWFRRVEGNEDLANARELQLETFLLEHASLPQLTNAQLGRGGTGQGDQGRTPALPVAGSPVDHRGLLDSRAFIGHVTRLNWSQVTLIQMYADLGERLGEVNRRIGAVTGSD